MEREVKAVKPRAGAKSPAAKPSRPHATVDNRTVAQRLADALAQQAATSHILRVMSDSPTDVQPVMNAVAEQAARLCRAPFSRVLLAEGDVLRALAYYSAESESAIPGDLVPLKRTSISGRAMLDRKTVHHADVVGLLDTEFPGARHNALASGFRAVLAVPLTHKNEVYGAIFLWRREPGAFAPDQVALVETFARQAAIAIANVRLFHATQEALEQQMATSEILGVISRSPTDVQPVFETIAANALHLCDAEFCHVFRYDGALIHFQASHGLSAEGLAAARQAYPMAPGRGSAAARAILSCAVEHIPDVHEDPEYEHRQFAKVMTFRSIVAVPMLRMGTTIGAIAVARSKTGHLPVRQVELLRTFADQAVIAIENVRLFKELEARNAALTETLEQQTATSEILRVISRSQTDVQPVFDAIAAAAQKLCGANAANVVTFDGNLVHLVASVNENPAYLETLGKMFPRPPSRETAVLRAVLTRSVVAIPNVLEDADYGIGAESTTGGFYSALAVPLMRDGNAIGGIAVGRTDPGPFPDSQVDMLKTFADQAVIAIENVRLFNELEARNADLIEALDQQTATSEILRVISESRTDVQAVFETIASAMHRLCRVSAANVFIFDGKLVHLAASVNDNKDYLDGLRKMFPRPPSRDTAGLRAIFSGAVASIPDVLEDPDYKISDLSAAGGFRSAMAVPLIRDGSPIGAIAVGRRVAGPYSEQQVALLKTFGDQAVIAIENVRLFNELQARTSDLTRSVGELKALGDVGQAVSSTLDLETVLSTIVSRANHLSGMDGCAIYEYNEASEEFYLHTADGLPDELVAALRATPIRKGEGALGSLAVAAEPVQIHDIMETGVYQSRVREILIRTGYRSLLAVPLLREDHLLGGLVVNRKIAGAFSPHVIDLLKTFATQSALAIQNARLFREIEVKSRQLETASQHKSEFLANMSHELRTPLNAIIGFSEVLTERLFGEMNDKQAEYVGDITDSGRHLLHLINDILDLSKIEAGRMDLDASEFDLATAIDGTLTLVRERAQRRAITLGCNIGDGVTTIHADERKVKQVLLNLLSNALKFTPEGGKVDVVARAHDDRLEIAVTDTGVGIAPEDVEAVFEEFRQVGAASKKIEGTGLGLAISRKFIELHGGKIWLTSQVGVGSTFAFTLPRQ